MAEDYLGLSSLFYNNEETPTFKDGDTFTNPATNNAIRVQGVDTLEVTKVDPTTNMVIPGDLGGTEATQITQELANKYGFTEVIESDTMSYGRVVGDLINPNTGERLSDKLLQSGIAAPTSFSNPEQINMVMQGRLDRAQRKANGEMTEWDIAGESLNKFVSDNSELRQKTKVINEQERAALSQYLVSKGLDPNDYLSKEVQVRHNDRTLNNVATSTVKTSWASAKLGFKESAWAGFDMVSDLFSGERNGSDEVDAIRREMGDLPFLENQNAFNEKGEWQIDSFTKTVDFVIGNAIQSAPYLVTSLIGAMNPWLLSVPAFVYAGQTYAEQEEKDISDAATSGFLQAVLDRIGIEKVLGAKSITNPQIISSIMAKKNVSKEAAEEILKNATRTELRAITKGAKDAIASDLFSKYFTYGATGAILKATAGESVTETLQEAVGMLGANGWDTSSLTSTEAKNRFLNAAVAGGTLGGTFSGIGQAKNRFLDYSAVKASFDSDPAKRDRDVRMRERIKSENPELTSMDIEIVTSETEDGNAELLDEQRKEESRQRSSRSFVGNTWQAFKDNGFLGFFRGLSDSLNARFGSRGKYSAMLMSVLGGNSVFSNGNIESKQHLTQASLMNEIGTEAEAIEKFGVRNTEEVSSIIYDNDVKDFINRLSLIVMNNPAIGTILEAYNQVASITVPDKYKDKTEAILDYAQRVYNYNERQDKLKGVKRGTSSFLDEKAWDKRAIARDGEGFIAALKERLGISHHDAVKIRSRLLDQNDNELVEIDSFDLEDIDLAAVGVEPELAQSIDAMREDPELSRYFHNNLFYNLSGSAGVNASKYVSRMFIGENGSRLATLIQKARDNGEINDDEVGYLAQEVKDILDIRKGKYKAIENDGYKVAQSFLLTWTTLAQLPLATVSAIVEVAQTMYNVPFPVLKKNIKPIVKSFAQEVTSYLREGMAAASGGRIPKKAYLSGNRGDMAKLGFLLESQTAAQKNDIRVGQAQQQFMDGFFKLIGLQGITNFTRTLRLSLAGDTINGLMDDVYSDITNKRKTLQGEQSRALLQHLGMDVDFMVESYKNNTLATDPRAQEQWNLAMFSFVNEAVAHPSKTNRPKFYQNPRLALFVQFQGFISTFTAQILPKIYGQMIGKGRTPEARLEAARNIVTLIAMGILSSYLRDFAKFGELPDDDDAWERLRRGINSSGTLGTAERLINAVSPMYPRRHDNVFESTVGKVTGESPALSMLSNMATAAVDVFDFKESGKEWKKVAKVAPLTGPFHKKFEEDSDSIIRSAIDSLF